MDSIGGIGWLTSLSFIWNVRTDKANTTDFFLFFSCLFFNFFVFVLFLFLALFYLVLYLLNFFGFSFWNWVWRGLPPSVSLQLFTLKLVLLLNATFRPMGIIRQWPEQEKDTDKKQKIMRQFDTTDYGWRTFTRLGKDIAPQLSLHIGAKVG